MDAVKEGTLKVPGAQLYYEVQGSGPVLLMVHGGNGDAQSFPMATLLSDRYTVITYDRRGHSRSLPENPDEHYRVQTHGDDAQYLLEHLTEEPVYVFGASTGAVVGLDLAIRYPEQIRMMVAHEPPLPLLLSGEDRTAAMDSLIQLEEGYNRNGLSAMADFGEKMGLKMTGEGPPRPPRNMERLMGNIQYFIKKEVPGIRNYSMDEGKLKVALYDKPGLIIAAGGEESRGYIPYQYAQGLAGKLGTPVIDFPGNHLGSSVHPKKFSDKLHQVLSLF
ncbi:Pimeloyl-ACP methyl ester carboxylesterase [Fictibacillus solisalsi]|uniref:Pimeloyl-ACP methyl ester carboxylesterase n=1 Tax=Fictibacillus solisalsi TaxID=459525 RepID=A0A1G9X9C3_9BACL|nr:alpha/beta fold hydrolase [Fictibacillus solisalsi]SDM93370.1 Pimeloyl-ACP methyl ester carboxylesterase [Fictibacillus solisalsi]